MKIKNKFSKIMGGIAILAVLGTSSAAIASEKENVELQRKYEQVIEANTDLVSEISIVSQERENFKVELEKKALEVQSLGSELARHKSLLQERSQMADKRLAIMQENDVLIRQQKAEIAKLKAEVERQKSIRANAAKAKAKVKAKATSSVKTSSKKEGKTFSVTATAYTPYCAGCSGITATGINVRKNPSMKLIAVDPRVIPLGSKVYVEGYGTAIAGDTGGAIKGNKIDLLMPTKKQAYAWGRRTVKITVLK